jgi:hypothetical protein
VAKIRVAIFPLPVEVADVDDLGEPPQGKLDTLDLLRRVAIPP